MCGTQQQAVQVPIPVSWYAGSGDKVSRDDEIGAFR
jgi:hypothetical protein